jgi:hypothetical protein
MKMRECVGAPVAAPSPSPPLLVGIVARLHRDSSATVIPTRSHDVGERVWVLEP